MIHIEFDVPSELGPAFKSAVEDFSKKYAGLLELQHLPAVEKSRTKAMAAIGILRGAVNRSIPHKDKDFV